jgi:hypothetical protein
MNCDLVDAFGSHGQTAVIGYHSERIFARRECDVGVPTCIDHFIATKSDQRCIQQTENIMAASRMTT